MSISLSLPYSVSTFTPWLHSIPLSHTKDVPHLLCYVAETSRLERVFEAHARTSPHAHYDILHQAPAPRLVPSRKHPTPINCQTRFSLPLGTARSTITMASVLLAISGVFVSMGSPVSYFDYMSPVPYCLLFISLMFSMIATLMSGSSMICWLHTDRHWTQEQLKQGNYFVLSYLLSIVTPIFFVAVSSTFGSLQLLKVAYRNVHVSVTVEAEAAVLLDV
ncbi:uncharacterized protein F5891DRAFT_1190341 [Suillus fuscotomentosus]|uniref:Uncharacterized protein n=1 Tax=Suillus fuscotomentosus TaxID=1912939 RepID=A0AAD4E3C5_9AGAM|nr:uncharacterized protein F5891DRAFT_1190341 [Suillus fuscotomentosus]KAG1898852.1 hypothetical protein F5891DRAFT_1190341 [Suillus fuscotomentosus]